MTHQHYGKVEDAGGIVSAAGPVQFFWTKPPAGEPPRPAPRRVGVRGGRSAVGVGRPARGGARGRLQDRGRESPGPCVGPSARSPWPSRHPATSPTWESKSAAASETRSWQSWSLLPNETKLFRRLETNKIQMPRASSDSPRVARILVGERRGEADALGDEHLRHRRGLVRGLGTVVPAGEQVDVGIGQRHGTQRCSPVGFSVRLRIGPGVKVKASGTPLAAP